MSDPMDVDSSHDAHDASGKEKEKEKDATAGGGLSSPRNETKNGTADCDALDEVKKFIVPDKGVRQKFLKKKIEEYRKMLMEGCGDWRCTNPHCFSRTGTPHSDREASLGALKLFKARAQGCSAFPKQRIVPLTYKAIEGLHAKHELSDDSPEFQEQIAILCNAFKHWEVLEHSILDEKEVSDAHVSLNLEELDLIMELIDSRDEVRCEVFEALSAGLDEAEKRGLAKPSLLQLRTLLIVLQNPLVLSEDPSVYETSHRFFSLVNRLADKERTRLSTWLCRFREVGRLRRMLHALQQYLTIQLIQCEEQISDLTNDWRIELGDAGNPERDDGVEEAVRERQFEERARFTMTRVVLVLDMIDLFWKANRMIIEESTQVDAADQSGSALLSPLIRGLSGGAILEQKLDQGSDQDVDMKEKDKSTAAKGKLHLAGISHVRRPLPLELFHNSGLNETICARDLQRRLIHQIDFWHWRKQSSCSYLQYPYLLDAGSKAKYIEYENHLTQEHLRRRDMFHMVLSGMPRDELMLERLDLVLRVKRGALVRDTMTLVQLYQPVELKRRLRVVFDGEQGVDQGGLTKEFFQLIIKELFDPRYGMFKLNEQTGTYWFNRNCLDLEEYKLIGLLIGIAIYNNTILDFRFPKVIFKMLLEQDIDFDDFRDFDPEMAAGFEQLLGFEGNVEDTFCRTFCVEYQYFGVPRVDEFKENGAGIPLTNENREEYVDLYVRYLLQESVKQQLESFRRGFKMVCDSKLFQFFNADELELLVCGAKEFDFEALEQSARYDDGYTKHSPTIRFFWEVVHSLSEQNKRKLLAFCTGSDRVPIRGLGELVLTISKSGGNDTRLPSSHTCFNHLLLPQYKSKEVLRERLLTAIKNSEGFGLL